MSTKIGYVAAHLLPTGYGEAARSHAKALQDAGATVMAHLNNPLNPALDYEYIRDDHRVNQMLDPKFWPQDQTKDLWIWHVTPDAIGDVGDGKPRLVYGVWEVEGLPDGWAEAINHTDGLLTCSPFSARLFREGGVTKPIGIAPHPIDLERFNPSVASEMREMLPPLETIFLVVSQWMPRKGVEDVLSAYGAEFGPEDPVGLLMLVWRNAHTVGERRAVKGFAGELMRRLNKPLPRAWVVGDRLPPHALPEIYATADVLVSASRGEAFNLPAFEIAAHAKPSISTGYGGMWDYLSDESAYRVAYDMETVHNAGKSWRHYTARQKWARPRLDDLRRAMREAHEDKEGRRRKGQAAFETVAQRLTYPTAGATMLEAIRGVLDTPGDIS